MYLPTVLMLCITLLTRAVGMVFLFVPDRIAQLEQCGGELEQREHADPEGRTAGEPVSPGVQGTVSVGRGDRVDHGQRRIPRGQSARLVPIVRGIPEPVQSVDATGVLRAGAKSRADGGV